MTTAALFDRRRDAAVLHDRARPNAAGYRDVDAASVAAALGKVRLVDVREPHELVGDLGHIEGVENVPLAAVASAAKAWDKDEEIVLVCRSGGRSARAANV